jgi:hypothetical protein
VRIKLSIELNAIRLLAGDVPDTGGAAKHKSP